MFIYGILSTIVFMVAMPFVFAFRKCIGKPNAGLKEKFGFISSPFKSGADIIMLHGVSVGEVIALENLAKKIKETFPDKKLQRTAKVAIVTQSLQERRVFQGGFSTMKLFSFVLSPEADIRIHFPLK